MKEETLKKAVKLNALREKALAIIDLMEKGNDVDIVLTFNLNTIEEFGSDDFIQKDVSFTISAFCEDDDFFFDKIKSAFIAAGMDINSEIRGL